MPVDDVGSTTPIISIKGEKSALPALTAHWSGSAGAPAASTGRWTRPVSRSMVSLDRLDRTGCTHDN